MSSTLIDSGTGSASGPIVLVCGAYKSGTSLATKLCEGLGFWNPAELTNPLEVGWGTSIARYSTRECLVLREQNLRIRGTGAELERSVTGTALLGVSSHHLALTVSYLAERTRPLVLKDPMFAYTLHVWLAAARHSGRPCYVLFTRRPREQLRFAWDNAPYTAPLLRAGALDTLLALLQVQRDHCRRQGLPHTMISLAELRQSSGARRVKEAIVRALGLVPTVVSV